MYGKDSRGKRTQYRSKASINQQLERMRNSPAFNPRRYSQAARIAEAYKGNIDYEQENGNIRIDDRIGDLPRWKQDSVRRSAVANTIYPRSQYAYTEASTASKGNSGG